MLCGNIYILESYDCGNIYILESYDLPYVSIFVNTVSSIERLRLNETSICVIFPDREWRD